MPNSKKASKDKKTKAKKNQKSQAVTENLSKFLEIYELCCHRVGSLVDFNLKTILKQHAADSKVLVRFTLQEAEEKQDLPIKITPLVYAIRKRWYKAVTELYFWDLDIPYEEVYAFSIFLQQPSYSVQYLEFLDCNINAYSIECFSRCLSVNSTLKTIIFDYTQIGDEGLVQLCKGLSLTRSVRRLSLCYCNLTALSGNILANLIAATTISELYLDGNTLGCDGLLELIRLVVERAESDAHEAKRSSENSIMSDETTKLKPGDKKKKKTKKKKKKEEPVPKVGPWLNVLHIANNGVDNFSAGTNGCIPLEIMQLMKSWVVFSADLKEIDISDNLIGDLAARELLQALKERKEAGLNQITLKVTHRIDGDIFRNIIQLSSSSTKRGKKKKKKKSSGKTGKRRI